MRICKLSGYRGRYLCKKESIMANLKMILPMILTISILGCATPPGKLTESDFLSREIVLDFTVSKAYSQFREGLRYCGPSSGGLVFATHHGIPECMPVQEDGSVLCDMYLEATFGGRSDLVSGRIELRPHGERAIAILKVRTYVANKDKVMKSWEMFLLGRAKEVCP